MQTSPVNRIWFVDVVRFPAIGYVLCLLIGGAGMWGGGGLRAAEGVAGDGPAFSDSIAPFLQRHCVRCHGERKQEAKLSLHKIDSNVMDGADQKKWELIAERLVAGEMPPEGEPRPSAAEQAKVLQWLRSELTKVGKEMPTVSSLSILPGQGNRLNHERLFAAGEAHFAASPIRLWRFSPQIYDAFARRVNKDGKTSQPFSSSSGEGFKDYADLFVIDEPTIGQLFRNASALVDLQTREKRGIKEFQPLFYGETPPTKEQIEVAIRCQFETILRRKPTADELLCFVSLYDRSVAKSGRVVGGKAMLSTVYLLPEALYRMELGRSEADEHGRQILAPRELAQAVGYALGDQGPDDELLKAAEQGRLTTREDVAREITRLLAAEKFPKPRIMRFFDEYFGYPEANNVFKDVPKNMEWRPEVFVNDTRFLVQYILDRDQNVFQELLTTDKSFVNYNPYDRGGPAPARITNRGREEEVAKAKKAGKEPKPLRPEYHEFYNLPPDWKWPAEQPVKLNSKQRAGILTQPSWLAAHATNNENHAIRRGKWVQEHLLGGHIPDVPITVDAQLPDKPELTLRTRMEITKEDYCWNCHQKMNPLGLTFEHYDWLGRYRDQEPVVDLAATQKNVDKNGGPLGPIYREVPVDASEQIDHTGIKDFDGETDNFVSLVHKLAASDRARQVFVRHAFRYWMGRNETVEDASTLVAADQAYVQSGGSMKALITSLLTSDSFLLRVGSSPK